MGYVKIFQVEMGYFTGTNILDEKIKVQKIKVQKIKVQEIKVQKIKVQKIKVQKIKVQKIKGQKIKGQKIKGQKIKGQKIKGEKSKMKKIPGKIGQQEWVPVEIYPRWSTGHHEHHQDHLGTWLCCNIYYTAPVEADKTLSSVGKDSH